MLRLLVLFSCCCLLVAGEQCDQYLPSASTFQTCEQAITPTSTCNDAAQNAFVTSINQTGLYSQPSCLNDAIAYTAIPAESFYSNCSYQVQATAYGVVGIQSAVNEPLSNVIAVTIIFLLYFIIPVTWFMFVVIIRKKLYQNSAESAPTTSTSSTMESAAIEVKVVPVYLSFHKLQYSVKLNKGGIKDAISKNGGVKPTEPGWDKKKILKGITGVFKPGTLSAIMGPSGCGKSTLLDVLADRKATGYTRGKVLINGRHRTPVFKRASGYVMQFDALFPHLTVREVLMYAAELRIHGDDWRAKRAAVAQVIKDLDLHRVADTKIGGGGVPGISGGQARRVTVGLELVIQPFMLFLDEPTTGLDAFSSLQLVRTLRVLADTGRTVMATIHQPRPDIFELFNTLLLMKDGAICYFGKVQDIKAYFESIGITIPDDASVADFVVDLTYSKEDDLGDGDNTVQALANTYQGTEMSSELEVFAKQLEDRTLPDLPPPVASAFAECDMDTGELMHANQIRFSQGLFMQVFILLRRSYKNVGRDRTYFLNISLQMAQFLFYGLLFLGLRTQNVSNPDAGQTLGISNLNYLVITQERAFLFQVMNTVMLIEVIVIANAFVEKKIFRREHASGAYSVLAYHAQFIIRFYVEGIGKGLVASILSYFFPPMRLTADAFFFFAAVMMVCSTMGSSMAFLMVSLVPNAEGAANIHAQLLGTFGLYSGFFLFPNVLPVWMKWLYYMLPFKYSFEALEWNQFTCMTVGEEQDLFAVDPTLNRWTNLLVFMFYPPIFHAVAVGASFAHTRPKSFWVKKFPCFFSADNFEEEDDMSKSMSDPKPSNDNGVEMAPITSVQQKADGDVSIAVVDEKVNSINVTQQPTDATIHSEDGANTTSVAQI